MIIRLLLLAVMAMAMTVLGHRIEIDPGEKQCFFEALQPQDKVSASAIAGWELEGQRKRGTRDEGRGMGH